MKVFCDYRTGEVTIRMPLPEFREHVAWLELVDPNDQATADWRAYLDDVAPQLRRCTDDPVTCPECSCGEGCMA